MISRSVFIFAVLPILIYSCNRNPLDIDNSSVQVGIKFEHMDSTLFHTKQEKLVQMRRDYNMSMRNIFEYQVGYCMRIGNVDDTAFENSMMQYRADPMIKQLEEEIATEFGDLGKYKAELIDGFKYLKAHISTVKIPKYIVFQNSLFQSSAFSTESELGIGLDRYLGFDSKTVKSLPNEPFYEWIKRGFNREFLTRDAVMSWVITHVMDERNGNLAEQIIWYGKALYLTQAAFPEKDERIILRYSQGNYDWALSHEYDFWKYLIDQELLFKINELNIGNYLNEGPFTAGYETKSSDRMGQFLGFRIVKNYMENSKTSVEELIKVPYDAILRTYEID